MKTANKNIIHRGNSIISVETHPDYSHPVLIKKPAKRYPSRRSLRSLEKEYEMTRCLDTVQGVRKALGQKSIENQALLILEYINGKTLKEYIAEKTLDLRSRLQIAVDLARILANIHDHNVIHLDVNSKNILIKKTQPTTSVCFIDLGSASYIGGNGFLKVRPDQMLGTLSNISPEQTGRINRAVDERSDLYSLGVVLYELVTGQLPFDAKDPLELVHHHLVRIPVSPSEISDTPEVISAIILKLLSKNTEDRYQSAFGFQADLEQCLQRLQPDNSIAGFPLAETDFSRRLLFSQKLYGRDRELEELKSVFEGTCQGTASIVFVGGYSGIGKTALVEEIQRPVSEKRGYFIEGKFDQLTTTPYAGVTQAFARFVSQILTQTETQLTDWRSKIQEAVGPNGRVLMDVVPSLELVIGPQPTVPDLSGQEAQNRFNYVFQRFFGAIARNEHPLCFFLDDLQWIDPGSLGLLKNLFTGSDLTHLLVIGAYRDNEVHEAHPLMTLIADLEKTGVSQKRMTLQKLSEADVETLISDAIRRDPGEIDELSRIVYSQTNGNPFFTRQVLHSMADQGLIALDSATGHWRWDMDALRDLDVVDSVVELLVGKLKDLPVDIQETLKVAACIGHRFDIATLTVVTAADGDTILEHVHEAVAAGLILESSDQCFFVHDRVQEAAYALVPINERDRTHLTIGRHLLQIQHASDDEQNLYKTVDQLNHGLQLIEDEKERLQIARLNLQAARDARQASAFETGQDYAKAGIQLVGENSWEQNYRLTLDLHEQAALMAYAVGDVPAMEHHSEQVLQFGRDPLDLARVQRLHIEFLLSSKRFDEAIGFGLEALSILGQEFPPNPDMTLATATLSELLDRLEREPPDYLSIPRLYDQDPELLAVAEIMLPVANAAFISRPALSPFIFMRGLELSLERRLLPEHTPTFIAAVSIFTNALLGKIEVAYAHNETAVELVSRAAYHTSVYALQIHGLYTHFWRKHLRETLDLFDRALQGAHDCGNNEHVSYATISWAKHAFFASIELTQVEERCLKLRAFLDGIQFLAQSRWVNIYVTATRALRGNSPVRGASWRDTPFDDNRDLPDMDHSGDQLGLLFAYSAKAWVATLFGDHDGVEEYSDLACSFLVVAPSGLEKASLAFICGLRRARELRENPDGFESEQDLEEHLGSLERFSGLASMNFAHKLSLVQAEVHRARGEVLPAMQAYEQASQGARENGYLNEAGLAHALAAEFYRELGLHQAALHNAEQAAQAWQSWGADALVENLSNRFADLLETSGLSWQSSGKGGKVDSIITRSTSPILFDVESIISASQVLSAETDLEQLLTKMITLVMTNSGADTVVLLLKQNNDWFVQARGDSASEKHDVLLNRPFDPTDGQTELIPEPVFNYCRRSHEVLVGDPRLDHRFAEDKTIQNHNIQSIACTPVLVRGELKAMLYLENRNMPDVFTKDRVEILKHLSTQFAISLENALLYDRLNLKLIELQKSEEHFRNLVDQSSFPIQVYTLDGRLWQVNAAWRRLWNLNEEEAGRVVAKYNILNDKQADDLGLSSQIKRAFAGEAVVLPQFEYSTRQTFKDIGLGDIEGGSYWIESHLYPVKDAKGEIAYVVGSHRDISERRQSEIELCNAFEEIKQLKDQLQAESAHLQQEIKLEHNFENIIGQSQSLKYVLNGVERVALTDSPVLIMGETGTGKELIARAIHQLSPQSKRPLVKVNCAALSADLIESELFGREKGAYTGAITSQVGRFELAKGSTLFLDEIGELPLELQAKLLRVLESGEFERLGNPRTRHSDARVVVATNRILEEEVRKGRFREDLWYRLKVFPITLPPLRKRPEDIPLLVSWFLDQLAKKLGKEPATISKRAMQSLQCYSWPGNVRELKHTLESALITAQGKKLNFELPQSADTDRTDGLKTFEEMEHDYVLRALKAKNWKIGGTDSAASILGIHVNTLRGRMKKLGIMKPKP